MLPAMKPPQTPERMRKLLAQRERHGLTWPELSRRSGLGCVPSLVEKFWRNLPGCRLMISRFQAATSWVAS